MENNEELSVDITPEVSVYATYKRLSYKPWYAIAEFVDNSTQNYFEHRGELKDYLKSEISGQGLVIDVDYDEELNQLRITDNANGMEYFELVRAVSLDKPPANTDGRSEFGMGLKTAACWFGSKWSIETTKLGSNTKYYTNVDVNHLVTEKDNLINVSLEQTSIEEHFTKIILNGLYKPIRGRTSGKIKELLGSIYREDLRSREITIKWNGEPVIFEEAPILIDTPAARISDINRENLAKLYCKLGTSTQTLLLLTPAEFDSDFKKGLEGCDSDIFSMKYLENENKVVLEGYDDPQSK